MGNDRIRKAKIEMFCLTNSRNIFSVNDVYEDTLWTFILLIFKTTCYFGNLSHDLSYLLHLVTILLRTVGLKESKCDKQALEAQIRLYIGTVWSMCTGGLPCPLTRSLYTADYIDEKEGIDQTARTHSLICAFLFAHAAIRAGCVFFLCVFFFAGCAAYINAHVIKRTFDFLEKK